MYTDRYLLYIPCTDAVVLVEEQDDDSHDASITLFALCVLYGL